jgi:hypothetical protein
MSNFSTFLFARPSFVEGVARVLDLGGTLNVYNISMTERQADFWAAYADWRGVGEDIRQAEIKQYHELLSRGKPDA